jgi:DNA-binding beta-propeller fold protein YncE
MRSVRPNTILAMALFCLLLSASIFVTIPTSALEDDQGRGYNGNQEMIVDPVRHCYYSIDETQGGGYISAFTYDLTTIYTVWVGGDILSMDLSDDGEKLYVTISQDKLVKVVDLDAQSVVDQIDLGFTPLSVAACVNNTVLVSSLDDTSVRMINATTDAVLWTVDVGFTGVLECSPDGKLLLAIASAQDDVQAKLFNVDESGSTLMAEDDNDLGVKFQQLAVDWDGSRIYLVSASISAVQVLSLNDLTKSSEMAFTGQPTGVAFSMVMDRIYAAAKNDVSEVHLYVFNDDGSFVGELWIPPTRTVVIDDQERYAIGNGRISLRTSIMGGMPSTGTVLAYTPEEITANIDQGIPAIGQDDIVMTLSGPNGSHAMPFHMQGPEISCDLDPGLEDGAYIVNISWNEGSTQKWYDWQFVINRSDPLAMRPTVDLVDPSPNSELNVAPSMLTINMSLDGPMPSQHEMTIWLDDVVLTAEVDPNMPWVYLAPIGSMAPGFHEVKAKVAWDGGFEEKAWNLTLLNDASIISVTPENDADINAMPEEVLAKVSLGYPMVSITSASLIFDEIEYIGMVNGQNITFEIPSDRWNLSADPLSNWRAIQGRHYASVEVQTTGGVLEKEWSFILETTAPELPLERQEYYGKFSVGLPTGWSIDKNVTLNGSFYQMAFGSPYGHGITTMGFVSTGQANDVKDDQGSLEKLIEGLVEDLSSDGTIVQLVGDTQFLQIDNRSATLFTLGIGGNEVMTRVGIIVSEAHDQYWIVMISDTVGNYNDLLPTYDAIVMSMDIEQEEEPLTDVTDIMPYILVGVIGAVVAGLAIFLVLRRRK